MRTWPLLAFLASCGFSAATDGASDDGPDPMSDADEPVEMVSFPQVDLTADDGSAQLPACASPLAKAMFEGARGVVWRGTTPGERFATSNNSADTDVLIDGPQIFPAFRALIAKARHHVSMQTYVWEPNTDPTNEILAGLRDLAARLEAERAEEPVTVRFLVDASIIGFGSKIEALPQLWASLEALRLDPRYVKFEVAGFFHIALGNLHVKTLVVDGRDAIVTGANPQAHHNYAAPWRDSGYRFTGDIAVSLLADFDHAWRTGHLWTCGADATKTVDVCIAKAAPITWPVRRPAMVAGTCRPMFVTTRQTDQDPRSNRIDNTQDQAFLAGWDAAKTHIRMQTPNLNDDAAKGALLAAVQRGVQVDVVLSRGFNDLAESFPGQGGDNDTNVQALYDALASIPNKCDRLRVRWYSRGGVSAVFGNDEYASHAKYSSIDDQVVVVGTANMDTQSWNNSREVNVVVDDAAITQAWDAQLFDADFARGIRTVQCP
jgi:phosphatidylserine/phosphatidylglycerophosphate/cardiolipin synthase-like enzyme